MQVDLKNKIVLKFNKRYCEYNFDVLTNCTSSALYLRLTLVFFNKTFNKSFFLTCQLK